MDKRKKIELTLCRFAHKCQRFDAGNQAEDKISSRGIQQRLPNLAKSRASPSKSRQKRWSSGAHVDTTEDATQRNHQ